MKESMMELITGKAKASTKALLALFMALPFLMQIDAVKNFVTPLLLAHPKISTAVGSLTSIALLLHNPQVQRVLGITTVETSTTVEVTKQ